MASRSVQLRLWRVESPAVPAAMLRMATNRLLLRQSSGLRFARLLGTGSGRTFTPRDADVHRWALLTVFDDDAAAGRFTDGAVDRSWSRIAAESAVITMRPLSSHGRWGGVDPFGVTEPPGRWDGPVAAITRARIRTSRWREFWAATPGVVTDLDRRDGVLLRLGIGEAPVGLQGTFSIWRGNRDLTTFAYRGSAHRSVIEATARLQWYAEELFARFAVVGADGTIDGRPVLDGADR